MRKQNCLQSAEKIFKDSEPLRLHLADLRAGYSDASSVFLYLPCPTGGQAEYGADSDHLDDAWVPRVWNPMFGFFSFVHNMAPFMMDAAPWEWEYAPGYTPAGKPHP